MFENIMRFFRKLAKKQENSSNSKDTAKERLHLVLMQDRANVSADFLDLMRQEIIDVIKKYIEIDENAIDVRLTNRENEDGTNGAPALYANIPIINIKEEARKQENKKAKKAKENEVNETKKEEQNKKVEKAGNTEKEKSTESKPNVEDSNEKKDESVQDDDKSDEIKNVKDAKPIIQEPVQKKSDENTENKKQEESQEKSNEEAKQDVEIKESNIDKEN